jgi:hypothetical protein
VRLHFAELGDLAPSERRFDIRLQDNVVLEDFDVLTHAGDKNTAVIKEFNGIIAGKTITLDPIPKDEKNMNERSAPTISGIEVIREG